MDVAPAEPAAQPPPPEPVRVELTRADFGYFNWTLALERPLLPALLAVATLCALAWLVGLLPAGGLLAGAALAPALLYGLLVGASTLLLWRREPRLAAPRRYRFDADGYRVAGAGSEDRIPFAEVRRGLATRRAACLVRADGSADLLPWQAFADPGAARTFFAARLGRRWRRSPWL